MNIENIKTDNIPLLDSLIYNLKKLAITCILKDSEKALKNETISSIKKSDIYIACIEGRATIDMFELNKDFLLDITDFPEYIIDQCVRNIYNVSESIRNSILKILVKNYIENYNEENNYYRLLNGQPPLGEEFVYLTRDLIPSNIKGIDISKPIHKLSISDLDLLNSLGVIDNLIYLYPNKEYLNHLGSKAINIYQARISEDFSLLYLEKNVPDVLYNRFKSKLELNKDFTLKTVYSSAYKFGSDYYDNFIRSFIIIQTMTDILAELPDIIIKREIFDIKTVQLIFESNGIDFFPEIPMVYQVAMIRNLNTLKQYKSTTKNIVDICSLFGFDNIKVFKYYLLKDRKTDLEGRYQFNYQIEQDKNNPDKFIQKTDNIDNYKLKFIKVPIDDIADNYLHDNTKLEDYDDIVSGDKYWCGDKTEEDIKSQIVNREFNYLQSKYISIDTLYNMAEMSFQLSYFFNMLFDNIKLEEQLTLDISFINGQLVKYKFTDIICYLLALGHLYENVYDDIMDTQSKIMYIKGFNFDADIQKLSNYVIEKGFTLEELGVSEFQIPKDNILTYNQLLYIFSKNKKIYDHVVKQMKDADNYDIYSVYKKIYDSLMIDQLTFDFFKKLDGSTATTFTEFLEDRNLILYNSIQEVKSILYEKDRKQRISDIINNIVYIIEETVNLNPDYKFIFSHLPTVSAEAVKGYIYKVINFFKSFKVQINSINTIYVFDDKYDNVIRVIDRAILTHNLTKIDLINKPDKKILTSILNKEDNINLDEHIYFDKTYSINKYFIDNIYKKELLNTTISKTCKDTVSIHDKIIITYC